MKELPNIQSAIKRVRVTERKTLQNKQISTALKTELRKFYDAVDENAENIQELYTNAVSAVDKAALKGTIHKNKANRKKSQLAKKLQAATAE